ncbi:MAG: HlyD family type I secretion periplasmic adaptor subunit [Caulobacterales bacterium]
MKLDPWLTPQQPRWRRAGDWVRRLVQGPDGAVEHPQDARRDIVFGLVVAGAFLVALLGWGMLARLDAGVYASGQVEVAGNRQAVQHKDGGIVSELDVREGDRVTTGQVLLKLAPDELDASERATADQVYQLEALEARLLTEIEGRGAIIWPPDFKTLTAADLASARNAEEIQQREFTSRAAELVTQKAVLSQRQKQLADEIDGYRRQVTANQRQQELIQEEIDGLQVLLQQHLVPLTRVRALQRDQAALVGTFGEYNADIARTEQQIGETRLQSSEVDRQRVADTSKEYQDAQMQLSQAAPRLAAIREEIGRATVRSPATGRVVGLTIFTVGGMVAPGQKLMDVVPENAPLVIAARIPPRNASDIRAGQRTEIRITAFHDRSLPLLHGVIREISADSFVDEKSGTSYFRAEIVVPPEELRVISKARGAEAGLRPGLPVEVVVPLRKRTVLDYLLEPLRRGLWKSFRDG